MILLFMVCLYPLAVIPQDYKLLGLYQDYFYAPRYVLLAAFSLLALLVLLKERAEINGRVLIPLGGFLFFALLAAILAAYPVTAWVGAPQRYTGLSAYFFCVILFLLAFRAGGREKLLPYMAGAAAAVCLLAILQVCGLNLIPAEAFRKNVTAYGTLGNPDNLGIYAAFVLPAALYLYLSRRREIWLGVSALILAGLLVSFTWGAWLGALTGVLLVCWFYRENLRQGRWALPAGILLGVVLVFAAGWNFFDLDKKVGLISPLQQLHVAANIGKLLPHTWSFGLGPDHLFHVSRMLPLTGLPDKAPGLYLEMAVTMGIFALLAYLVFIGLIMRNLRGVLPAMITVYLVQGLFHFEGLHLMPLFWIVLGLGLAESSAGEEAAKPEEVPEALAS
jgi:hypothetical protein